MTFILLMHYNGKADHRPKPAERTGAEVFDMVKDLKVIFGKGPGGQSIPKGADGHAPMWKKKSIFWELEYWKVLEVRSAIDVMHVTKNICVNLLSFLGVYGKTNDTKEARQDQQRLKDPITGIRNGFKVVPYALTKEEKVIFFECLSSMKVPSGFSSNIKGIINMAEKKFQNLKSHDCHVIMTQLLPIALRGLLPENVRVAIVKLCAFLNAISQKVINPEVLPRLHNDVVQCLVSFELVFPPSFFNIMTHLLVHLVEEISILGPVFLHNMFPFERFMGVLKKYVRNRARPEGSIAKGYGNEEVIEFCVDFVPDLKSIGLPRSRHEGRLSGKGTIGRKSTICMDGHSLTEAHHTVLTNSSLVAPYFEKHKNILRSDNPGKPESWIRKAHMETFGSWLRKHLMSDNAVVDQLYMLAKTPSSTITTFQGKRNIVGVEDKTDMSEDYNMFAEIPPFKVNTDPSIKLNDEDAPWIRHNRHMADDRADPILDNYDPDAEDHMFGIINGDIPYVPTGQEDDISSYLNLDGEDEGQKKLEQFLELSEENAAKKEYNHIMGPGYRLWEPRWEKMENELRARKPSRYGGMGPKGQKLVLIEAMRDAQEGKIKFNRENDALTKALGNPEHGGRVRGMGHIPWKIGFPQNDDPYGYRSRKRKMDRDADVVARLASEMDVMKKTVSVLVAERDAARAQHEDHPMDLGSQQRRSSVASTEAPPAGAPTIEITAPEPPVVEITAPEPPRYPVDDIKEMKESLHHNNPIADGYARVTVEDIVQGFEDLDIDIATPEGARRLGDVKRQFILWQKKFIKFPGEAPRRTSPPSWWWRRRWWWFTYTSFTSADAAPNSPPAGADAALVLVRRVIDASPQSTSGEEEASWVINPEPYVPATTNIPEPSLKPLTPRPWELSVEENAAAVAAQHEKWKADYKKKREPEPKQVFSEKEKSWAKSFLNTPSQPRRICLTTMNVNFVVKHSRRGKQVAQLGEQSKQSIAPHIVKAAVRTMPPMS
ncbi:hypothetical protein QYE76_069866 [Lolium multiflorum]|uniref:DUF4218 domain-containing protein n=1 Tax=Lolium multiflorum TaxID=4521 RepID=A0AAD8SIL3_LOLMU|nr:hypothetical protein QYE76_069866 [Lolium multiflorum]